MSTLLTEIPRIAVKFTTVIKTHQEMLLGILRYVRGHGPWALQIFTGREDEQQLSRADAFSGYIGIFTKPTAPGVPVIYAHDDPRSHPHATGIIKCDNESLANTAADFFLARGYESFAYVGATSATRWSMARSRAFKERLKHAGRSCAVYPQPPQSIAKSVVREQRHLGEWLSRLPERTGVFVANDVRGRQLLEVCRLYEIPVPGRLAVLSCDNEEFVCETTVPTLSSMRMSCEEAGYRAAELLDKALHGVLPAGDGPANIPYAFAELIERQSTAEIRHAYPLVERARTIIRLNVSSDLSVPDLVAQLNVSRRLLELRFREETGHTPHQEIVAARIQRAKTLLAQTDMTLEAIAERSGFASASHFC